MTDLRSLRLNVLSFVLFVSFVVNTLFTLDPEEPIYYLKRFPGADVRLPQGADLRHAGVEADPFILLRVA